MPCRRPWPVLLGDDSGAPLLAVGHTKLSAKKASISASFWSAMATSIDDYAGTDCCYIHRKISVNKKTGGVEAILTQL